MQGSIGDLTQACCNNIKAIVTAAGSSVEKIVKVNVRLPQTQQKSQDGDGGILVGILLLMTSRSSSPTWPTSPR